ncbi:MAG: MATE family efflux transporter [Oscillospiraceae bacterium]|nr:MATE family efflux transporter [Oscillospiraceae bacterium]
MQTDFTTGAITGRLFRFALPMMVGNLLQQLYNIADTLIVGKYLGPDALGAVGSSYTLMVFLTSILLGLCMGSGAAFSQWYGRRDLERLRQGAFLSFCLIALLALALTLGAFFGTEGLLRLLRVHRRVVPWMRAYLRIVFLGVPATFLYNYFATLLRAVGNSVTPLIFLGVSAVLNVGLDLWFVLGLGWSVRGAAAATVLSQYLSGAGLAAYALLACPDLRPRRRHLRWSGPVVQEISGLSLLTCVQQSVMNLGILMVQGLVNSFGPAVMAAFAAAVKVDSFAYMPAQDFGNAFSTFVAQNYGAGRTDRIRAGLRRAAAASAGFCAAVSAAVYLLAEPLMGLFVEAGEAEIIAVGAAYLRIEGAFYCGIGLLFLWYGCYRAVKQPGMSVALTAVSLGTRVALAYGLSAIPAVGLYGVWASVPVGWLLADILGLWRWRRLRL